MAKLKRDYTTWEEDLCSDRCEFHGYDDELVAVVDKGPRGWFAVRWSTPTESQFAATKEAAQRIAEGWLQKPAP